MELLRTLQVVFGIGLVIFVHELGHYIAARICGVRVETFALGLGPRIFGWRKGATVYQVGLVPIGGFCRMAGEERRRDGLPPAPDELPSKSVEARFFIYSAGVLMNVAFALVVFPILFTVGVPFDVPRIGAVAPGGPAWEQRVKPGSEVLAINGADVFEFSQIRMEVALGGGDEVEIDVRDPDSGETVKHRIRPVVDPREGLPMIGVGRSIERDADDHPVLSIRPSSPAYAAGLRSGDRLIEVLDGQAGLTIPEQLNRLFRDGKTVRLRVANNGGPFLAEITPESVESEGRRIGIRPATNYVAGVRPSAAAQALGIQEGDRILEAAGRPIVESGDWYLALHSARDALEPEPFTCLVRRENRIIELTHSGLDDEERDALVDDVALVPDVEGCWIVVQPGEAADAAGLRNGDLVREVDGTPTSQWADVFELVGAASAAGRPAVFKVERRGLGDGPSRFPTISVTPQAPPPDSLYGIDFSYARYTYRSDSALGAIQFGFYSSWKLMNELWMTLKGLVLREVPMNTLGGIVTISRVSYQVAEEGWPRFFFFLCFISMNLAVINVLPIPVLDGGHLFFLIVEKLKGSPVSERVLGYSQMIGVVLILSLMVYVTYNDIARWLVD